MGASIFLNYLVQPSLHKIVVPYGAVDVFTYERYHKPFYALGWATRMENDFFHHRVTVIGDHRLTFSSGTLTLSHFGNHRVLPKVIQPGKISLVFSINCLAAASRRPSIQEAGTDAA